MRSTVKPIALLALLGVVIAAGVTATVLKFGLGLDWVPAWLLGTILAITDTVSEIAVFKEIAVPSRLITIVEGESLFNDGVALVLFNLILLGYTTGSVSFAEGMQELVVVIAGGSLVGLVLGYLSAELFARSDDNLSSILLTVALALGAYQVAHCPEVSGVVSGSGGWADGGQCGAIATGISIKPGDALQLLGLCRIWCEYVHFSTDWGGASARNAVAETPCGVTGSVGLPNWAAAGSVSLADAAALG